MSGNSLALAGDSLAETFDSFLECYQLIRFSHHGEMKFAGNVTVLGALRECFVSGLRVFSEMLKMAPKRTVLRQFLAQTLEHVPVGTFQKARLTAAAKGLWTRYPQSILDNSCEEIAQILDLAIERIREEARQRPEKIGTVRNWAEWGFGDMQCDLLEFLETRRKHNEGIVIRHLWKEEATKDVFQKTLKARLRKLVRDTNANLIKFRLNYKVRREVSRRPGLDSQLFLADLIPQSRSV